MDEESWLVWVGSAVFSQRAKKRKKWAQNSYARENFSWDGRESRLKPLSISLYIVKYKKSEVLEKSDTMNVVAHRQARIINLKSIVSLNWCSEVSKLKTKWKGTSFPGSLILPPLWGGKMRDPANEVEWKVRRSGRRVVPLTTLDTKDNDDWLVIISLTHQCLIAFLGEENILPCSFLATKEEIHPAKNCYTLFTLHHPNYRL